MQDQGLIFVGSSCLIPRHGNQELHVKEMFQNLIQALASKF